MVARMSSPPHQRRKASATEMRSKGKPRSVSTPCWATRGGSTARNSASASSIIPSSDRPGAYHSSMVNSGAWRGETSPFRQTRASSKTGPAPATSSRLSASSGEVRSQRSRASPGPRCGRKRERNPCRCTSMPGTGTSAGVSTSV